MENGVGSVVAAKVMEHAPAMIAYYDPELKLVWANRAYREAVGGDAAATPGRNCRSLWGCKLDCENCPAQIALKTGEPAQSLIPCEEGEPWPFGRFGWIARAATIRDENGAIMGVVETAIDDSAQIAGRRNQEKATGALMRLLDYSCAHDSQEILREFLDEAEQLTGSHIGFYHFVEDDQATLSLQCWSSNTMQNCTAAGAGTHYPISKAGAWADCVGKGAPVIHNDYASLPNKRGLPEGHAPIVRELVAPVVREGKVKAILGVGNKADDYTCEDARLVSQLANLAWEAVGRRRADEEREKLQAQILQMQKLEAVGQLAGGVAHDFNNMLGVILGHVEMALEMNETGQSLTEGLTEIKAAAQRSADLTRQLLAFARRQTIAPRVLSLNETIGDMLKMLRRLIGEDFNLEWMPNADLDLVKIDPAQIDQALANLCINARDAIEPGGRIVIETANAEFDEEYCAEHAGFSPGRYVMLAVSDNGLGIQPGMMDKIFLPFYTTKKTGEGTGLGLATVYGVVRQNQGFVNVYSEPEHGSTFKLYFPAYTVRDGLQQLAKPCTPRARGEGETILVLEDEHMILDLSARMLESLAYRVLPASTPAEAIRLARKYANQIDLLITDVVMPESNGCQMSKIIGEIVPNLKTMYMSGYTANVIVHHGVIQEGVTFLQKPFSKNELSVKVREALAQTRA